MNWSNMVRSLCVSWPQKDVRFTNKGQAPFEQSSSNRSVRAKRLFVGHFFNSTFFVRKIFSLNASRRSGPMELNIKTVVLIHSPSAFHSPNLSPSSKGSSHQRASREHPTRVASKKPLQCLFRRQRLDSKRLQSTILAQLHFENLPRWPQQHTVVWSSSI